MVETWRVGRKLRRTLYVDDQVVGMVDTPDLAARIVAAMNADEVTRHALDQPRGRSNEPGPGLGIATSNSKPGRSSAEVQDLDGVRDGHVPWPGDADDGTCSCCGMPHPCVTRRLADELGTARSRVAEHDATMRDVDRALDRAEKAEAQLAAARRLRGDYEANGNLEDDPARASIWHKVALQLLIALDGAAPLAVPPRESCRVWHDLFGVCELPYGHEGHHSRVPGGATEPNTWPVTGRGPTAADVIRDVVGVTISATIIGRLVMHGFTITRAPEPVDADEEETTQWCVFALAEHPDEGSILRFYDDGVDAYEDVVCLVEPRGVAYRTVTSGPWTVAEPEDQDHG